MSNTVYSDIKKNLILMYPLGFDATSLHCLTINYSLVVNG
jgi:hypothetical protein